MRLLYLKKNADPSRDSSDTKNKYEKTADNSAVFVLLLTSKGNEFPADE